MNANTTEYRLAIVAINPAAATGQQVRWKSTTSDPTAGGLGAIAAPVLDRAGFVYTTEFEHHVEQFDAAYGTLYRKWTQNVIAGKLCQTPTLTEDGLLLLGESSEQLKRDLALRPIYHQLQERIDAHIFVSFIAYCLHVTLKGRLRQAAPGLTPRAVLEKFAAIQMLDVHFPTSDGRELVFCRYTQPEMDHKIILTQMGWELPLQPPPRISAQGALLKS